MPTFKTKMFPKKESASSIEVTVEAKNASDAKKLLEAQYGKDKFRGMGIRKV